MDTESSDIQLKKQNSFIIDIFSICNYTREEKNLIRKITEAFINPFTTILS